MKWVEATFLGGSAILSASLLPAILVGAVPPLLTCLLTGSVLAAYTACFWKMGQRASTLGMTTQTVLWFVMAYLAFTTAPPLPSYDVAPAGIVLGAADGPLGTETHQYRLIVRASDDFLPYTVRVDEATYRYYTESNLGRSWPRE